MEGKQPSQLKVAHQLDLTTRQVRNLQYAYRRCGAKGLISKRRGQPSNHRLSAHLEETALELIKTHYGDFGPTLAHEKLTEYHHLELSVESVRRLMREAGLWHGKRRRHLRVHPSRPRRSQRGELIQIDGSLHAWFEDRGPHCCLIVFIDDATSQLLALRFIERECTEGYFQAMEAHSCQQQLKFDPLLNPSFGFKRLKNNELCLKRVAKRR